MTIDIDALQELPEVEIAEGLKPPTICIKPTCVSTSIIIYTD